MLRSAFALLLICCAACSDGGTGSTSAGGSGSSGGAALVNGCDPASAIDMSEQASVTIAFGGSAGFAYVPACVKVKSGTAVTFQGDNFTTHPLVGGTATRSQATPDPSSPIHAPSSGTSFQFTAAGAASFPFYCANHFGSGMMGAIFVAP